VVCVFARKTSEPLTSLVKQIDRKIGENNRLKSFVVITTQQKDATAEELKKLAQDAKIQHVPLTMFGEPGGPPDYELARNADITVLMWKEHKVKVNHAFRGELTDQDIRSIVADIPQVLGD
jgi:predicted protein tyrosine phosphatase